MIEWCSQMNIAEDRTTTETAPAETNVALLGDRLIPVPAFSALDGETEAREAAEAVLSGQDIDFESVESRAHAANGAISTLDMVAITGREYSHVFSKEPARSVYAAWVHNAHAKLSDIMKELDNA